MVPTHPRGAEEHDRHSGHGGDNAPDPVGLALLRRVAAHARKDVELDDRVDDGLQDKHAADPAMEQDEGGVRPVGEVEEDVVAGCSQHDEREDGEGEYARAVGDVDVQFDVGPLVHAVRPLGAVAEGAEEDVEQEEGGDVEELADGEGVAEVVGEDADVVVADEGGVEVRGDEVGEGGDGGEVAC